MSEIKTKRLKSWSIFIINSEKEDSKDQQCRFIFQWCSETIKCCNFPLDPERASVSKGSDLVKNVPLCQGLVSGLLLGNLAAAHINDLAHWCCFPDDIRAVNCCALRGSQVSVHKLTVQGRAAVLWTAGQKYRGSERSEWQRYRCPLPNTSSCWGSTLTSTDHPSSVFLLQSGKG